MKASQLITMNTRMKIALLSGVSVLLALIGPGCASVQKADLSADQPGEKARITKRLNEIFDAAQKKDLERLDSYHFYGPKFTKFSASSPGRLDAAAARKGEHDGITAANGLKMQAEDLKIDVFGDVAIATFTLNFSFKSGTDTIERKEQSTLVFVKDRGDWKITHEHFSPIPSPAR